jgi:YidC/Oxa1 family membrane protein insertase
MMDFNRLFLFLIFSMSMALLWDAWHRVDAPILSATTPQQILTTPQNNIPVSKLDTNKVDTNIASVQQQTFPNQIIKVKTDFLVAEISTLGGDLQQLEFLQQRDAKDRNKPFILLQKKVDHTYIAQSGLLGSDLPTHNTMFASQATEYSLIEGKDTLEVRLAAQTTSGIKVTKIYLFRRGNYLIDIIYEIENNSLNTVSPSAYFQFIRDKSVPEGGTIFVPTFTGPAIYTEADKFQKYDFSEIEKGKVKLPNDIDNGWIGMLQHYFVAAWLPVGKTGREFYAKALDGGLYSTGVVLPIGDITPGSTVKFNMPLYAGPAQTSLDEIAPGLGLTVDYGWLTIFSIPLFSLLVFLYGWVSNWGVAIILLTVLIKIVFFPLSAASYKSMGKMRVVAPKLEKIKQMYGDDRERLHKAMMELYKTEKINPMGGCLPVLIQIPIFIALYWAILASVELRYAPFFGWITDLSVADPYYVLPIIMGISMVIQGKLNPVPQDPFQAKLMQVMPIAFSIVFFFFPAGLVLYSIVNNILSIAQQWYITRSLEAAAKGAIKS